LICSGKSKESIDNYTYAKLTLAKTIGDTELKNIYVRPVLQENDVFYVYNGAIKPKK
jgi:hypothetical protein